MKKLWAPWRFKYILHVDVKDRCIFCDKPKGEPNEENLVLYKGKHAFIIMNLFPYNSGHVMVAPYKHTSKLSELSEEELLEIMKLVNASMEAIELAYSPQGFNVGMNLGRSAGAGIEDHIHVHVVPRWIGDTNFMPIIADTKVIPEGLKESYAKLKLNLDRILGDGKGR